MATRIRPRIREMLAAGATEAEIAAELHHVPTGELRHAIRESRDWLERTPDPVRRRGPFDILYVAGTGLPVYYVGGGHAIHGDHALKAMRFGDGAPKQVTLEVVRPVAAPVSRWEEIPPPDPDENIHEWVQRVATLNGVSLGILQNVRRFRGPLRVLRDRIIFVLHESRPDYPLPDIGRIFDLDRTSVIHGIQKVKRRLGGK